MFLLLVFLEIFVKYFELMWQINFVSQLLISMIDGKIMACESLIKPIMMIAWIRHVIVIRHANYFILSKSVFLFACQKSTK